jgi:hypothetical protein
MRTQAEILERRAKMKVGRKLFNRNDIPQRHRPKKPDFKNGNDEMQWIQNELNDTGKTFIISVKHWGEENRKKGNVLTKKQKTDLIKSIPDNFWSEKDLIFLVNAIRDDGIKHLDVMPDYLYGGQPSSLEIKTKKKQPEPESESDESESDEEVPPPTPVKKGFTPTFTKFGNLDNFSKESLVRLLERRTKIDPKVRASIRNTIKNNKCQCPEQFDNYKLK